MAEQTVQRISKAGLASLSGALVAAEVGGDSVPSSSDLLIVMENASGAPRTLTIAAPSATVECGNLGELDVDPITITVAAGETGMLSAPLGYNDANNAFSWTYDDATDVNVGVFKVNA